MRVTSKLVIEGRAPGKSEWSTVTAMVEDNAACAAVDDPARLQKAASDRLHAWQRAAADQDGSFRSWEFRIAKR